MGFTPNFAVVLNGYFQHRQATNQSFHATCALKQDLSSSQCYFGLTPAADNVSFLQGNHRGIYFAEWTAK